jgi:hypothetical protein
MVGGGFQHDVCSSSGSIPKEISGLKALILLIYLYIDYGVMEIIPDKSKINYAWLSESKL